MPRRKRSRAKFGYLTFLLASLSVIGVLIAVLLAVAFARGEFRDVSALRTRYPKVHYKAAKTAKDDTVRVTLERERPAGWTPLPQVSKAAVGAIIVSEDWAFYQHKGYDPNQIREAIKEDWESGHFARGASTITQQVARNVFLDQDKNLWRKVKELYFAVRLEREVGKRRILETYLNIAEWGRGIYGIRAAAQHYFGKRPDELTAKEGAFLAMLLPSPKRYSQSFRAHALTPYARETVESILFKMTQARYLTAEEKDQEIARPLSFETAAQTPLPAAVPLILDGSDAPPPADASDDGPEPSTL